MKETEISSIYKAMTGSEINIVDLNLKLKKGEEIGLVNKILTNVDDKPYVKWRTNF